MVLDQQEPDEPPVISSLAAEPVFELIGEVVVDENGEQRIRWYRDPHADDAID